MAKRLRTRNTLHEQIRTEALDLAEKGDLKLMMSFIQNWTCSGVGPTAVEEMINATPNPHFKKELGKLRGNVAGIEMMEDTEVHDVRGSVTTPSAQVGFTELYDIVIEEVPCVTQENTEWTEDEDGSDLHRAVERAVRTLDQRHAETNRRAAEEAGLL